MARKIEVASLFISKDKPVSLMLRICEIPRSTWYYQKSQEEDRRVTNKRGRPVPGYTVNPDGTLVADSTVIKVLKAYRDKLEFSNAGGYHKLKHYLRRDYGYYINHKKLYRLCRENDILLPYRKKKPKKIRRISTNRVINGPNQLWEFDIKYGYIHGENKFFFVMAFIDVFSRKIVGYHIGRSCKAGDLAVTLECALAKASGDTSALVLRSDNGPQMTSNMFRDYIADLEIDLGHEFIPPACPNKNAHIESFFSILETEFLQTRYFKDYRGAYEQTMRFIEYYNSQRLHGSLGNRSPMEAEACFYAGDFRIKELRV